MSILGGRMEYVGLALNKEMIGEEMENVVQNGHPSKGVNFVKDGNEDPV